MQTPDAAESLVSSPDAMLLASDVWSHTLLAAIEQGFCIIEKIAIQAGEPSDYRYLVANPAFQRHTHLPDPVGKTILELVPNAEPETMAYYDRVVATGKPEQFEAYVAALDLWIAAEVHPTAHPGQLAVLFTDITERKRAEDALRENEDRQVFLLQLSDALRPIVDPIAIQDTAARLLGEHLGVSRAFYAEVEADDAHFVVHHDYTADGPSYAGRYLLDSFGLGFVADLRAGCTVTLADPERDARVDEAVRAVLAAGTIRAFIGVPLVKDGQLAAVFSLHHPAPHNWSAAEIALVEEVAERTWAAVERARAEAALLESEERYHRIVDQATDYAIFSTDAERRIETWSLGAEVTFGWTPEEVIGQLVDITFTPEDRASGHIERELAQAREEGSAPNVRWHQRKDGTPVFIDGMSYARQGENGTFQGIFKVGQDVTARLQAEEARRETEARYREALEAEVAAATIELRTLSRRLLLVQEEERRKLALELHDEIGQVLTGLSYQLAAAQGANGARALADAERTVQALTAQVRQMALALRPEVLDRYGLLAALEWHCERFRTQTGITIHLRHQGLAQRFTPEVEIAAFRVVQEALTNVARHSGVDFATVHVHGDEDGALTLVIRDAGQGFDPAQHSNTSGLGGMRERVELLGGRLEIESSRGEGTTVIAELPAEVQQDPTS